MRALPLMLLVLAACHPEIASGSYLCGPEATCPEDQACDEVSDTCVAPASAEAFACGVTDHEPDNDVASATVIDGLTCVSTAHVLSSCVGGADTLDMATFTTPAGCSAIAVSAVLEFAEAYEGLQLSLTAADGTTVLAMDTACASDTAGDGHVSRCLTMPVAASTTYALRVEPTGEGDCGGDCAFNRYRLSVQLTTP